MKFQDLPALGDHLDGGIFCGITTQKDGAHAAVILLPNKSQERLNWKSSMAWAKDAGGVLPNRPVAALLFANAKDQFEESWHWTSDEDGASYAWYCHFTNGSQYNGYLRKSFEACARAVRLIPLTA